MKAALLCILPFVTGCTLYFGGGDDSAAGALVDAGQPAWGECGQPYTATIFEPAPGSVLPTSFSTRVRWNDADVPDRYMSMSDHYGNFFQSHGIGAVQGDGSIIDTWTLPAGGSFEFEIGWLCDVQKNGGHEAVLASIQFQTQH